MKLIHGLLLGASMTVGLISGTSAAEPASAATKTVDDASLSRGEIKKIDKDAGKITLKHGPLTNLNMPAMTMVFKVKSPQLLNAVKVGETVRFRAENIQGALTVTQIERAAP